MSHFVPDLDTTKDQLFHSQRFEAYAKKEAAVYTREPKPQLLEYAHVPHHDASDSLLSWMDSQEKSSQTNPTTTGRESVPALDVPLDNLPFQDDEMLSWLQYPLEDSFDKAYCAEELFVEGQSTHPHFVQDAFSHLSLREGEKSRSAAIRPQAPLQLSERVTAIDGPTMTHTRDAGLTMPNDTNTTNAAMAVGAQRAAGLLCQSGAEAFSKVRTTGQPSANVKTHNVVAQTPTSDVLSFDSHALRAGDGRFKPKMYMRPLAKSNFPLFSCVVGASQTSALQITYKNSANGERETRHGEGEDGASELESMGTTGIADFVGSMARQAHPYVREKESSTLQLSLVESTRQPLVVHHLKEWAAIPVAESTLTRSASCKLERDLARSNSIERTSSMPHARGPCASSASHAGTETGRRPLSLRKGLYSLEDEVMAIRNGDSSMQLEQAGHDCQKSSSVRMPLSAFPMGLGAGRDVERTSCGLSTLQRLCETHEACDVTMASSSGVSSRSMEKSCSKEAAPPTSKRKAHAIEDSEIESKVLEEGKTAPVRTSGPKRSRAAEIHNLSERKRRNKINTKMKALQDLIPNANKTDKASILDEAIEYVKMLQSQVQMMSFRSGMVGPPILYPPPRLPVPSMQQRLQPPHLNMDLGTGMEMGQSMGVANMFDVARLNSHGWMLGNHVLGQPFQGFPYNVSELQLGSSHGSVMESRQCNMPANGNVLGSYLFQQQQHQQERQQQQRQEQQHQQEQEQEQLQAHETPL